MTCSACLFRTSKNNNRALLPAILVQIEPMPPTTTRSGDIRLSTLAQLMPLGSWQLDLAHDRREDVFVWITRGQGLALIDGIRRGIGAHNALFLPAGTLFALDIGRQGFGQAIALPQDLGLNLPARPVHLRTREAPAQMELNGLLDAMQREQTAARPMLQAALAAHAQLVTVWLHRQIELVGPETLAETSSNRILRALAMRITAPGSESVSLETHAAAIGVTPTHLARVCKAGAGRSAAALITERRLHRARSLLAETDTPISDIARLLGFSSAAYFTRFIQAHCGMAPSDLRKGKTLPMPNRMERGVPTSSLPRVAFGPGSAESNR